MQSYLTGIKNKYLDGNLGNTFMLSLGQVSVKFAKAFVMLLAINTIGLSDYGVFSIVMAFISIFFIPASFLHVLSPMVRDLSSGDGDNNAILNKNFNLRVFLGLVVFLLGLLGLVFYDYSPWIFIFLGLALYIEYIRDFFTAVLESQLKVNHSAVVSFLYAFSTVFLVAGALVLEKSLVSLVFGYFLASLVALLFSFFLCIRYIQNFQLKILKLSGGRNLRESFSYEGLKFGLFWSLPNTLMFQVSLVVLSFYLAEGSVAVFSIVFQIIQTFGLFYIMFANSSLPRISSFKDSDTIFGKIKNFVYFCAETTLPLVSIFSFLAFGVIGLFLREDAALIKASYLNIGLPSMILLPTFTGLVYSILILGILKHKNRDIVIYHLFIFILFMFSLFIFQGEFMGGFMGLSLLLSILVNLSQLRAYSDFEFYKDKTGLIFIITSFFVFLVLASWGMYNLAFTASLLVVLFRYKHYLNLITEND